MRRNGALPTFLIVGAQKAGTSTLGRVLSRHPDVGMPARKELHYFNGGRRYARGLAWYQSQFHRYAARAARFEATPGYLYVPEACTRIARDLPVETRFVALVRDPVDRAYSHYWHGRRLGAVAGSFEEALRREPAELASGRWVWSSLVDRGRYFTQLERFAAAVGRERILVVRFDDLVDAPADVAARVADFVGVEPAGAPWGVLPHSNAARRAVLPATVNGPLIRALPYRARVVANRLTSVPFDPPPMADATRGELALRFRDENDALAIGWGVDVSSWTR